MTSNITINHPVAASTASTTSVYGTTPGGTPRISYSRDQLLNLASSPLSRSPPKFDLPAAISRTPKVDREEDRFSQPESNANLHTLEEDQEQEAEEGAFSMDL